MDLFTFSNMLLVSLLLLTFIFLINNYHILSMLIVLESLMLLSILYLYILFIFMEMNPNMILVLFTMAASEAAIGLSILVSYIRLNGNDLISSQLSTKM